MALLVCVACGVSCLLASPSTGDDVASIYKEGSRLLKNQDYRNALEAFEKARDLDPDSPKIWLKLGMTYSGLQDTERAIEAYRRSIELDPGNAKALNNLANVFFRQGLYEEASEWYYKALELDPGYILAGYHYGWILRHQGRLDDAERVFRHVIEQKATNERDGKTQMEALYFVGAIRFRKGDFERTATIMERVIEFAPGHPEARYYLAMTYRRLGRDEEAREQLELHREITRSVHREKPVEKQPPS
jgi:tetratricopeptide (TPR) repeat protein